MSSMDDDGLYDTHLQREIWGEKGGGVGEETEWDWHVMKYLMCVIKLMNENWYGWYENGYTYISLFRRFVISNRAL